VIVEVHDKLRNAQRIECTQIVVRDINNTPIAIVLEHAPGQYFYKAAGEEGFDRTLQALGITDTVIVSDITPTEQVPIDGKPLL